MKKALAVLALVCLLSGSVFASGAELLGMGGIPAQLTKTDQILGVYPAQVLNFGNEIVVEYDGNAWGYTLLQLNKSSLFIGLVPRPSVNGLGGTAEMDTLLTSVITGTPSISNIANVFSVIYGLSLGKTGIGLSILYGSNLTSTTLEKDASTVDKNLTGVDSTYLKILAGASLDIGMPLDVVLSVAMPNYSSNPKIYNAPPALALTDDDFEKLAALNIGLGARAKMNSWLFDLGITYISQHGESRNWLDGDGNGTPEANTLYTSDDNEIDVSLLASNEIAASKSITMLIGGGVNVYTTHDSKDITKDQLPGGLTTYGGTADSGLVTGIPVYFTAECKLNDTFNFRAGVNKTLVSIATEANVDVNTADGVTEIHRDITTTFDYDSPVNIGMGVTGVFGDLKIDWYFNQDLILYGPYLISGSSNDISMQFAINYAWK